MARSTLSLATLGSLNSGAAEAIIDAAIARAVADLDDRGDDGKPRQVLIRLEIARMDNNGFIACDVQASVKVPAYRTAKTAADIMQKQGQPVLVFQEHNPERADQGTFPEMDS